MVEIVTHGTLDYSELAQLGIHPDELAVFSSNINPYGPPPAVIEAVRAAVTGPRLAQYPDRLSAGLRAHIAAYHKIAPESIVVGNGTADLMWLIGLLFVQGQKIAVLSPTFGEYENIASLVGTPAHTITLPGWRASDAGIYTPVDGEAGNGEARDMEACLTALRAAAPQVVFLCNPNNPTGELYTKEEVQKFLEAAPQALWVIDEAYMEFTSAPWSAAELLQEQSLIVLRSMTKDFALGGLRLGYLVAEPARAQKIQTAQPPWNVNILAQIAGEAAMESLAWRAQAVAQLRKDTEALRARLSEMGLEPRATRANYFLTPIADPADLRADLLRQKLLVRDCTSFGLPTYFRIATQMPDANMRLAQAIGDYLASRPQTQRPG